MELTQIYDRLLSHYGPQHWWPGESPWEIVVGAILVQNTAWKNVEQALENLKAEDSLSLLAMQALHVEELAKLIRPAGYYRLKAKRLKNLIRHISQQHQGDLESLFALDIQTLREELLSLNGIGPETADSIILYAANKPIFVVDTYTARVMKRHHWIWEEADYHQIQEQFHSELPEEPQLFNEYHALLVQVGKEHCRKQPKCEQCPLAEFLPEPGPVMFD